MDDFLDPYLSIPSWTYPNIHENSPWDDTAASQLNGLLSDRLVPFGRDDPKPNTSIITHDAMVGSLHIPEANISKQTHSSIFSDPECKYIFIPEEHQLQPGVQGPVPNQDGSENGRFSFSTVIDHGMTAGSFGAIRNPIVDASMYLQSLADSLSSSGVQQMWESPSDVAGLVMGQSGLHNFGSLGNGPTNDELLQLGNFQRSLYENEALRSSQLSAYASTAGMKMDNMNGLQVNQQSSNGDCAENLPTNIAADPMNSNIANNSSPNGVAKPRARARRGQATDPHSIAERLRREKIAERMKNLQELVPNSNKTDKASMLDEIIEYVKFLQLQVKVLSMSRVGAAGAIVPLITDMNSQGSRNLFLTSAADSDLSETEESEEFEREVVKLMESGITSAMQFLQTKGLCLMPIALASAISARKGSLAAIPRETDGAAFSKSNDTMIDGVQEQNTPNGCNMAAAKQEEAKKVSGNGRNFKPMA